MLKNRLAVITGTSSGRQGSHSQQESEAEFPAVSDKEAVMVLYK